MGNLQVTVEEGDTHSRQMLAGPLSTMGTWVSIIANSLPLPRTPEALLLTHVIQIRPR